MVTWLQSARTLGGQLWPSGQIPKWLLSFFLIYFSSPIKHQLSKKQVEEYICTLCVWSCQTCRIIGKWLGDRSDSLKGLISEAPVSLVSQREAGFGTNRYTLSLAALSHDHQGLVSITGVHLPPAIQTAKLAVGVRRPGHEPNTPLHHWHHLSCSRVLDEPNSSHCSLSTDKQK